MTIDLTADIPAAAAAAAHVDLTYSSDEEETPAQRVKHRKGRKQSKPHAGAYQEEETQRSLAAEEMAAMQHLVELRDDPERGRGLFAKRDIGKNELRLSYFGRHYASKSLYDEAFPLDDAAYTMEHRGEYFDGEHIEQLARYVNHSRQHRNLVFVDDEDSPYVRRTNRKRQRKVTTLSQSQALNKRSHRPRRRKKSTSTSAMNSMKESNSKVSKIQFSIP